MADESETMILLAGGQPAGAWAAGSPLAAGAGRLLDAGQAQAALFASPAAALALALAARADPAAPPLALHACPLNWAAAAGSPGLRRAQAVLAAAGPGRILLSAGAAASLRPLLPAETSLRDWGVCRLIDLTRPEHLFELAGAADEPAPPAPRTLETYPTNLPAQPSALIGREAQVEAVAALLRQSDLRLLTLTGPGGIGKTRLAVHAAARLLELFPDGVWFVDLAPLSAPAQVLPAIAQVCGVKDSNPAELLDRLVSALQGRVVLLALDNAEHVLEAADDLAELLARLPSLQLLVTSRERLHLSVEHEFVVPPLGLAAPDDAAAESEAVRLFLARAQSSPADRRLLRDQLNSVAAICQRLDGLPLAIELAAARCKLFPPAALLARLHNSLPLLTGGGRDVPARQQTLRAAVAWSYDLLNPVEQALLRRLAVFAGGWDLAALEAVCADPAPGGSQPPLDGGACLAGLDSLIDKSLVHAAPGAGAEPRFRLLQTIRDFALEQLASGEQGPARRRHAAYFADLAAQSEAALRTALQQQWLARVEDEHDNLRAALHWSIEEDAGLAAQLAGSLWRFWWMRGHWTEGRMWIGTVLARRAELPDEQLARLLLGDGVLAQAQGAIQRAAASLGESLALWELTPNRVGLALALNALGNNQCMQGGFAAGLARFQASLAVWRALDDQAGIALALNNVGLAHIYRNEYAAAKACFEEVIPLQRRIGTRSLLALSLNNLGNILSDQGDYRQSRLAYEESLALRRELGDRGGTAIGLLGLANLARVCGAYGEAEQLLAQSADQVRGLGDFHHLIIWTSSLGEIAFERGRYAEAQRLFEETLALARRENDLHQQATMGARLALAAIMEGAAERCEAYLKQALPLLGEAGNQLNLVVLAETAARLALARREAARAAAIWGAAAALVRRLGVTLGFADQARDAELLAALRAALPADQFAAAWEQGQALAIHEALRWQPAAPSPGAAPAGGLSEREREVLRLLVQGMTNAEIAARLVLSLFTVKAHVRSIYSKLGVKTRTAAARYAHEHQLM